MMKAMLIFNISNNSSKSLIASNAWVIPAFSLIYFYHGLLVQPNVTYRKNIRVHLSGICTSSEQLK